ncbi:MAG TPA: efflux RND transporter periplasmic adaptor subunit [Gemmatimonadales bacterium]|nr:efflux RND transporter periplasmic adaptor subunit [Gemmatimonadales bacterium]
MRNNEWNRVLRAGAMTAVVTALAACGRHEEPDAWGNVEAEEVVVGSQAAGQLLTFVPEEGSRLAAGAQVAVIDTVPLVLQLRQYQSQRAANASHETEVGRQMDVLEVQRDIAQRNYERTRRLLADQGATAQQMDQAERDYKTLLAQIEATKTQQQTAGHDVGATEARMAQIRDQIQRSRVTNPQSGTVLATYVRSGEVVQNGQPLYKIASLDTLTLRAYITEPQLAEVKLGQSAEVSIDAGKGERKQFTGTVSWVASEAQFTPTPIQTREERANLVYAVKIRVPNPEGVLKIGMPADVRFGAVARP